MTRASRRSFLRLALAGGVSVMTGAASGIVHSARAASAKRAARAERASGMAPTAAMRKEIANQKQFVARTLKTLRDYPLPTGSPMAFVFRPLRGKGRR